MTFVFLEVLLWGIIKLQVFLSVTFVVIYILLVSYHLDICNRKSITMSQPHILAH